jgi:protein TonB
VVEAKEGANYLKNPRPRYPHIALREGWEGRVILRVQVLPNGKVGAATVQKSAGRSVFDEAALEIVKSWSFVPATQGGKPVAGWVAVPFDFRIN